MLNVKSIELPMSAVGTTRANAPYCIIQEYHKILM